MKNFEYVLIDIHIVFERFELILIDHGGSRSMATSIR